MPNTQPTLLYTNQTNLLTYPDLIEDRFTQGWHEAADAGS